MRSFTGEGAGQEQDKKNGKSLKSLINEGGLKEGSQITEI